MSDPVTSQGDRPRLLDLFCCAGGMAMGYYRAGFDVVGVDIEAQPHYPFEFIRSDAMGCLYGLEMMARLDQPIPYDAIHASPPCQAYANVTAWRGDQSQHPDLLPKVREHLDNIGLPYVIENVPGAPMVPTYVLCGSQFGLPIRRHRWFEMKPAVMALAPSCQHRATDLAFEHKQERAYADAMRCDWMSSVEARQAIPPAYGEWIGARLLEAMEVAR